MWISQKKKLTIEWKVICEVDATTDQKLLQMQMSCLHWLRFGKDTEWIDSMGRLITNDVHFDLFLYACRIRHTNFFQSLINYLGWSYCGYQIWIIWQFSYCKMTTASTLRSARQYHKLCLVCLNTKEYTTHHKRCPPYLLLRSIR